MKLNSPKIDIIESCEEYIIATIATIHYKLYLNEFLTCPLTGNNLYKMFYMQENELGYRPCPNAYRKDFLNKDETKHDNLVRNSWEEIGDQIIEANKLNKIKLQRQINNMGRNRSSMIVYGKSPVNVNISNKVKQIAKNEGISLSPLIRKLLNDHLINNYGYLQEEIED